MSDIQNIAAEPAIEELETVAEQGMTQDTEDVSGEEEKKLTAEEKIWQEIYEENGLKLELKLTHMDLYAFLLYHAYCTFTGVIGILLSVYCLVQGIIQIANESTDTMTAVLLFIGVWFLIVSPVSMLGKTATQMKTNPSLSKPITYWFTEKGMLQEQGEVRTGCKWEMITKTVFLKNIWILYAGKVRGTILPVKQFDGREAELRALIKAHTGKRKAR